MIGYLKRLRRVAKDSVVVMDAPRDDDDRLALFVAERAGALKVEAAARGQLKVTLGTTIDAGRARDICKIAKDRGWKAYRAVEAFSFGSDTCRRAQLLAHFGDTSPGDPDGRCCDVCAPIDWLPDRRRAAAGRRRRHPLTQAGRGQARRQRGAGRRAAAERPEGLAQAGRRRQARLHGRAQLDPGRDRRHQAHHRR